VIEFTQGDILTADVEALVNTVNCVGIMGRGIALQFRNAFPDNYQAYATACERSEVQPGRMFVFETRRLSNPRFIINFPTKRHWRGKSRIEDIDAGLRALIEVIEQRDIHSIAIPPLGAGLGGLDWADVRPRIEQALAPLQHVRVIVFEPIDTHTTNSAFKASKVPPMTPGRAALVGLMDRYLQGLLDPFVTLLEAHKLMYFMQEAGQPLRLRYEKAPYGPYAENLRHVFRALEGHMTAGYLDGGDAPDKLIAIVPGAARDAADFLANNPDTLERFDRVANLVEGFETPFGLELLATVHWVAHNEEALSPPQAQERVYAWNDRKRRFKPDQIELAWHVLEEQGWLHREQVRSLALT